MAVEFDGEFVSKLVAFSPRTGKRHGESVFFQSGDTAFELSQFVQIDDRLVAGLAQKFAMDECAARGDILQPASRFLGRVRKINSSASDQPDTAKPPLFMQRLFNNVALAHAVPPQLALTRLLDIMGLFNKWFRH